MVKEERDPYTANLQRLWRNFVAATKERGVMIQKVTMAAFIQIATKTRLFEKESHEK